jgi:hypothetical protein
MFIERNYPRNRFAPEFNMRRGAPPNMKMGLRNVASIINIWNEGRPPVSLGTAVVDPLTISPFSSDKMLGSVLCAREAHLFSEQERDLVDCTATLRSAGAEENSSDIEGYKHLAAVRPGHRARFVTRARFVPRMRFLPQARLVKRTLRNPTLD